jgi:hypothetical protein
MSAPIGIGVKISAGGEFQSQPPHPPAARNRDHPTPHTPQLAQKLVFCNSDLDESTAVCKVGGSGGFHEVHACEMHVYEVHTHEMHAYEIHV